MPGGLLLYPLPTAPLPVRLRLQRLLHTVVTDHTLPWLRHRVVTTLPPTRFVLRARFATALHLPCWFPLRSDTVTYRRPHCPLHATDPTYVCCRTPLHIYLHLPRCAATQRYTTRLPVSTTYPYLPGLVCPYLPTPCPVTSSAIVVHLPSTDCCAVY